MPTDPIIWYATGGVIIGGVIALIPALYITNRVAPYAYPNARIRAMRAGLVRTQHLAELASRPYNDIIYHLEQNHYPGLSQHTGADRSFANLDAALRSHLVEALEKVKRVSPQQTQPYLKELLSKYDIQVIENVVRSLATQTNITSDILHQTPIFSKEFITKEEHTLNDLRNELKGTRYEELLTKHLEEIQQEEFAAFEQALDLQYFEKLLSKASSPEARGYTKRLIDQHNVSLLNKGQEPVIPGGRVPREELAGLDGQRLVERLREAGYDVTHTDKQLMERDLQVNLKNYAKALLSKEPLSEASIIGFVALKIINVRNTAILLKMKYHDMSPQRIAEVLAQ